MKNVEQCRVISTTRCYVGRTQTKKYVNGEKYVNLDIHTKIYREIVFGEMIIKHITIYIIDTQLGEINTNKVDMAYQKGDIRKACKETHGTEALKETGKDTTQTETGTITSMKIMTITRGVKDLEKIFLEIDRHRRRRDC